MVGTKSVIAKSDGDVFLLFPLYAMPTAIIISRHAFVQGCKSYLFMRSCHNNDSNFKVNTACIHFFTMYYKLNRLYMYVGLLVLCCWRMLLSKVTDIALKVYILSFHTFPQNQTQHLAIDRVIFF